MLESLKHEDLQFQELTPEEKTGRGILARLTGPIASFTKGTRNGRKYSDKLWEKAFDSPLVKEMFKNGGLPGELQHPEGRSETDPTKIAIMMPEPPKKDAKGHLVASVDILDTPCGQIAYQLGKYGFKFGISSRGEGDLIQDFSGEESVDPDTYTLNAFDLVLIPACEDARLQFNESLETKPTNKLKTILSEALENASDVDRRIMEEALDELDLSNNYQYVETYHDEDIYFDPESKKYIVGDIDNQTVLNSVKNAHEYIDRFMVEGIINEEQVDREETKPAESVGEILKNKPQPVKEVPQEAPEVNVNVQVPENDIEEDIEHREDDEPERESWDTDFHRLDVAYNHNFKQFDDMEAESGMIRDFTDDLDAQGKEYDIYKHTSDPGCTIFFEESLEEDMDESLNEALEWNDLNSTEQSAVESALVEINNGSTIEDAARGAVMMYNEENANPDYEDEDFYMEEADLQKVLMFLETHSTEIPWEEPSDEQLSWEEENLEEDVELAADDDGALVEQLQNILKQNKSLEEQVKKLQEKISVGYAKEIELKEELDSYKQKVSKLSEKTKEIKVLTEKLSKAETKFEESKKVAEDNASTLNESIKSKELDNNELRKNVANLNEAIDKKNTKIRSLNEEINNFREQLRSKDNDIEQLKEQFETSQKDLEQLKNQYSKKLEKQNQIIEKYQRVAKNSVKRYIESQAVRLGVKSDEIVNRLPKNYSFNDIDTICEDLQEYKFNMNNLPFGQYGLNESMKVTAKNIGKAPIENPADEITDYDLKIAEAFL